MERLAGLASAPFASMLDAVRTLAIALATLMLGCDPMAAPMDDAGVAVDANPDADSDGDGIPDRFEEPGRDTDGDGTPDYLDLDSDDDGIPDADEAMLDRRGRPRDTDADGAPDFVDPDSDGNGSLDADEPPGDLDGDGESDRIDLDDDGDGVRDVFELEGPGGAVDPDGDGLVSHRDPDSDGDTILDGHEVLGAPDTDGDGTVDFLDLDSDGDGVDDATEAGDADLSTPPVNWDADGAPDFQDLDSDNDGLSDAEEREIGTDRDHADTDGDGVIDLIEVRACPPFDAACAADATDPTRSPSPGSVVVTVDRGVPPVPSRVTVAFTVADAASAVTSTYVDDARDAVDTLALFVEQVRAHPSADATLGCEAWPAADTNADGVLDTFTGVDAGATVCFDVVVRQNDDVASFEDILQIFAGWLRALADGTVDLGYRAVGFLIPAHPCFGPC